MVSPTIPPDSEQVSFESAHDGLVVNSEMRGILAVQFRAGGIASV
jgi:hypothetical protein